MASASEYVIHSFLLPLATHSVFTDMADASTSLPQSPKATVPLLVVGLLLVDSLHFVFARLLHEHLQPMAAVLYVMAVASVQLVLLAGSRRQLRLHALRHHPRLFAAVGFLIATSTVMNYAAMAYIDPGTATLLAQASIVFGLALGGFWLGDRLRPLQWLGVAVALPGLVVITFQPGDYIRLGSLLILVSALLYALHAALVKRYAHDIPSLEFLLFRVLATTGFLLLFSAGTGEWTWPTWSAWPIVIVAGTVDVVLSRGLYYLALRRLRMSMHAIVLAASPVVTIAWAYVLFATQPSPRAWFGGAAVLAGVLFASIRLGNKRLFVAQPLDRPERSGMTAGKERRNATNGHGDHGD